VPELRCLYRLQLLPHLTFDAVRELVPYLRDLGISHLYLSPVLQARRGSTHGYDVADPTRVSEELGGEAALRALCEAARDEGLGVVLDVVPNHMAATDENPLWADDDKRARYFDWDRETGWYRRFFDIGELGGVRGEDEEVFDCVHRRPLQLVRDGLVEGFRVDHIDGLADPRGYLERLRAHGLPSVWVEKILEPGEHLRAWPVEGTTGYEFANDVARLFLEPAAEAPLTRLYTELSGTERPYDQVAFEAKFQEAQTTFAPECERLRHELGEPFPELERALASFEVYRTYVEPWSGRVEAADREAVAAAEVPERLARMLLLEDRGVDTFVTRFQQTTGPVVAKGVEDTAFYRYNRFVALNQVGGSPGAWTLPLDEFHRGNAERAERFSRSLLTTHTHDAKRSSDVTARLVALSWYADEWMEAVARWRPLTAHLKPLGAPDGNEEYLIFQTLVGAWPISQERLLGFVEKAMREAKTNTSWVAQNELWEAAVKVFCFGLYGHEPFRRDFEAFVGRVAEAGRRIALGQLLLKLTCPGVPDVYQGDELELLQLVDPDNREPVDWRRRRMLLDEVMGGEPLREETAQLHVLWRVLRLRAALPEAFAGPYEPLDEGEGVCAFARGSGVRVSVPIRPGAAKSEAPDGWRDLLPELHVGLLVRSDAYPRDA
jgi:(1->4)-alpha-D-glucan 1-alpha-D-glucosylmutase